VTFWSAIKTATRVTARRSTTASNARASSNTRSRSIAPTNVRAERLEERGARIERVRLDYELRREYQRWLHERDRERDDYDGHPDRTHEEIHQWALEHDLPSFENEVHFPDLRIEYEEADGRQDHDDIDVVTEHYRGAHAASVSKSGFITFSGSSASVGSSPFDPSRRGR
jgi:hypothetical protein